MGFNSGFKGLKVLLLQVHLLSDGETGAVAAFSIRTVSMH